MLLILDVLWAAPQVLSVVVLFLVFRRKLEKQAPFFVSYLVFHFIEFVTFFTMAQISVRFSTYQLAESIDLCISTPLTVGVIYELGKALLVSRRSLAPILRRALRWTLAVLLLVAAAGSALLHEIEMPHWRLMEPLDFSSALIRTGMVFALFAFASALRISWQRWTAGIGLGLGITACVDLATIPLRAAFGSAAFHAVDIVEVVGYNMTVLMWLIYLLLPDRKLRLPVNVVQRVDMEAWNEQLEKMALRWRTVQRWINCHLNIPGRFRTR
jgi:hypothetical protein